MSAGAGAFRGQVGGGWRLERTYASLPGVLFERVSPARVSAPRVCAFNRALAAELGIDLSALSEAEQAAVLSGQALPDGSEPIAQAYAGHQFGHFTMLGDGRAMLIGEQRTPGGRLVDIHCKGAGPTPYSRSGDGLAVLGPMLREHVISEAMHALGIPTTRSLAVVSTGDPVLRDRMRPGAILVRVASSHIRVGTFQFLSAVGDLHAMRALADYAISRHDPSLGSATTRYADWLDAVVSRQASLVARWQLAGFVHGVMNTDNMAISGETIDYGPCAFMDTYHRGTVFSSIDHHGRYAYASQPSIALWNLARFAEAILPLLHESHGDAVEIATAAVHRFPALFEAHWLDGMRRKLGLQDQDDGDGELVHDLLSWMERHQRDFVQTFADLSRPRLPDEPWCADGEFLRWHERWMRRLGDASAPRSEDAASAGRAGPPPDARQLMEQANPVVIPRNHMVEHALESAEQHGNLGPFHALVDAVSRPFDGSQRGSPWAEPPPATWHGYRTTCGT